MYTISKGKNRLSQQALFGSSTKFIIQNAGNYINGMFLSVSVNVPSDCYASQRGWLYSCIKDIQFEIGTIDNTLSGEMFKNMSLLYAEDREMLLKTAGEPRCEAGLNFACIPLYFYLKNMIPFYALSSPLQITISWNNAYNVFSTLEDVVAVFPTKFESCNLIINTYEKLSRPLPIEFLYNSLFVYESVYDITTSETSEIPVHLVNPPRGMLYGIILTLQSKALTGSANGQTQINWCNQDLSTLRLECGNMSLYDARSYEEITAYDVFEYGDSLQYDNLVTHKILNNGLDYDGTGLQYESVFDYARVYKDKLYVIPFCDNAKNALRLNSEEMVPQYSNAPFILYLKMERKRVENPVYFQASNYKITVTDNAGNVAYPVSGEFLLEGDIADLPSVGLTLEDAETDLTLRVGYIIHQKIEISGGVARTFV